jgi:hypothetical protein
MFTSMPYKMTLISILEPMSKSIIAQPSFPQSQEKETFDFIQESKNSHRQDKLFSMSKYKL